MFTYVWEIFFSVYHWHEREDSFYDCTFHLWLGCSNAHAQMNGSRASEIKPGKSYFKVIYIYIYCIVLFLKTVSPFLSVISFLSHSFYHLPKQTKYPVIVFLFVFISVLDLVVWQRLRHFKGLYVFYFKLYTCELFTVFFLTEIYSDTTRFLSKHIPFSFSVHCHFRVLTLLVFSCTFQVCWNSPLAIIVYRSHFKAGFSKLGTQSQAISPYLSVKPCFLCFVIVESLHLSLCLES